MLTALCPPIHGENGVSSKISRAHGISTRGFALYETKTTTFTQGHPCWNRRLGFPWFFSQIVAPPFLGTKLWFKGGSPFWDPEKQFLSRSVLLKLIRFERMSFGGKLGTVVDRKNCLHLVVVQNVPCLSVLSFNSPGIKLFSKKAHVGTFKEGTAFLGSDLGLRVLEMNLGPLKTEWKVLGPWSLDFCMVSTLSIKTKRAHDVPC